MNKDILKSAGFRHAKQIGERWKHEALQRKDLQQRDPILYHAYVCETSPSANHIKPRTIGEFFEGSWGNDPNLSTTRESLIRLFAIAVKAHFFLFRLDYLEQEPLVFWVPDLMRTNQDRFGLYCPFLKSKKTLVVAEADLALVSSGKLGLGRFPVILTNNTSRWFDEKHWESLAREADMLRLLSDPSAMSAEPQGGVRKKEPTIAQPFALGYLFDVPEALRPQMRAAGLRWSDSMKKMYLPKGFDVEPVKEYYEHLLGEYKEAHDHMQSLLSLNNTFS